MGTSGIFFPLRFILIVISLKSYTVKGAEGEENPGEGTSYLTTTHEKSEPNVCSYNFSPSAFSEIVEINKSILQLVLRKFSVVPKGDQLISLESFIRSSLLDSGDVSEDHVKLLYHYSLFELNIRNTPLNSPSYQIFSLKLNYDKKEYSFWSDMIKSMEESFINNLALWGLSYEKKRERWYNWLALMRKEWIQEQKDNAQWFNIMMEMDFSLSSVMNYLFEKESSWVEKKNSLMQRMEHFIHNM